MCSSIHQVADFVARSNQLVEVAGEVVAAAKDGIEGMKKSVWMGAFFMPGAFLTVRLIHDVNLDGNQPQPQPHPHPPTWLRAAAAAALPAHLGLLVSRLMRGLSDCRSAVSLT